MKLINDCEITYKDCSKLREILENEGINLEPPEGGGAYDDHVIAYINPHGKIEKEDVVKMVIWPSQGENEILRFRVVLIKKKNLGKSLESQFSPEQWKHISDAITIDSQNFIFFGHIDLGNMLGITLEHSLDTTGGILTHNIVATARRVARDAWLYNDFINKRLGLEAR